MTDPTVSDQDATVDSTAVEELLQTFLKGLGATQLYMPNNPVYQTAIQNLRNAFGPVWEEVSELVLKVQEHELKWEGTVVLSQPRSESIGWLLYKDGVRSLTIMPGAEDEEILALLRVLHQARTLPEDAEDDLLTLLWEQDFELIRYTAVELGADDARPLERGDVPAVLPTSSPREALEAEAAEAEGEGEGEGGEAAESEPERPSGLVSIDDFDSTLYFLDDTDIAHLKSEIEREYQQDLRGNVLSILFDLLELQSFTTVRSEIISIVESFIPYLLGAGDFRSVAYVLREIRAVLDRAPELDTEHEQALRDLPTRLSEPDAVGQLLQSLDEAVVHPTEEELSSLFAELRGEALETILEWLPRLSNERVRELLGVAVQRIAAAHPDGLARALGSEDEAVVLETVHLASKLKLPPVVPALGGLLIRDVSAEVKVATVEALAAIGSPSAMQQLEKAVSDRHRDVRVATVRVLGNRGHRAAFQRIEAAVLGKELKAADLTEKMVFFEAYGLLAGPTAIQRLKPMLSSGGFMRKKQDPETRACAAMALGKIGTPDAQDLLQKAGSDKDPLVRNAVSKALREAP
ncbi:MAG: HEAT repeat domain-containing protein [Gemmatimonadetes bacterium]|nr:HEAT repeat domain-containing protein [Gemmatimonadota bacterium]